MRRRRSPPVTGRLWGHAEFSAFLDRCAREIFGVSGPEFERRYYAGEYRRHPKETMAGYLASVLPFTLPRPGDKT